MDERMEITKGTHRAIPKTRKVASHATQEKATQLPKDFRASTSISSLSR